MTVNKECPEDVEGPNCVDQRCVGSACYSRALKSDYTPEGLKIQLSPRPGVDPAPFRVEMGYDEMNDPVNHPKHYTSHPSGIECIEITRHMGFNLGNTVKYIWRDGLKNTEVPLQDLKKALWYLKDEITVREERN